MPHLVQHPDRTFHLHGVTFTAYACGETGTRTLAAWQADFPPATSGHPHTMSEEEVLRVLAGTLEVEVDGERDVLRAGDVLLVPAGARLTVDNPGPEPAAAWVTTVRGMTAEMGDGSRVAPPWAR